MAGFRDYSLDKFVSIITDAGYTAVVYVQEKNDIEKILSRKLDAVHSPGTYISESISNVLSNNVLSVWVEIIKSSKLADRIVIGCATINVFTGHSSIFEYATTFLMNPTIFDDLEKFVSEFIPNEALIVHNFDNIDTFNSFMQYTGICSNIPIHVIDMTLKNNKKENDVVMQKQLSAINCTKQTYINQIISSFFGLDYFSATEFNRNLIDT